MNVSETNSSLNSEFSTLPSKPWRRLETTTTRRALKAWRRLEARRTASWRKASYMDVSINFGVSYCPE